MIDGWADAMYTRTMGMVTDTVYSYTDQDDPTDQAYLDYYTSLTVSDRAAVSSILDGVLTIDGDDIDGNHKLFEGDFGITGPNQVLPAPTDDTTTEGVDEAMVSVTGAFNGIPGTFMCPSDCGVNSDEDGNLDEFVGGEWTFTPTELADGADPHIVRGVIPDPYYLDFGYWLQATEDEDGEVTYAVLAFAEGNRDYGTVIDVEGTAVYAGPATGLYVRTTYDPNGKETPVASGQFTARATLTATFGQVEDTTNNNLGTIPANLLNSITGMVSNFMNSDGEMIDDAWEVEFMKGAIDTSDGTFEGMTTGMGAYSGTFHGDTAEDAQPSAASGIFDGHFPNGDVLGAFGANKR
jgi:hypothetical protein